jgi:phosphoglycolate phosphatase-like HAD superfamily hydrolase
VTSPAFLFDLDGTLVDSVYQLSGGYGEDELQCAGAYRVYADPADLLRHLDELGVRSVD